MSLTAQSRWEQMETKKHGTLDRAWSCAELTVPSLLPRDGHHQDAALPTPYQSLGARGVNNLASRLLMAFMPANIPFFRLRVDEDVLEQMGAESQQAENALRKIENRTIEWLEDSTFRPMLFAAIKHLVVTGNAMMHIRKDGKVRLFRISNFSVARDAVGNIVEIVIKESVHPYTLSQEVRDACEVKLDADDAKIEDIDVYTWIKLDPENSKRMIYEQQINDIEVPGSTGSYRQDTPEYIVLRWEAVEGEDYGRGHVEQYLGDLRSHEGTSKAIVSFAAIAAKVILMRKPNARTDEDDLADAETGDVVTGDPEDVKFLQLEKFPDFQVAKGVLDELTLRLSHAFLLQSGTVRNAERVTAEEIRAMAEELENVLGGVYTVQTQEMQLPVVRRVMAILQQRGKIPQFPRAGGESLVQPHVVTGFDALGRSAELNRLRGYVADLVAMVGERAYDMIDEYKAAQKLGTGHNVDPDDILKSEEDYQESMQQKQQAAMMDKAVGPMAGAAAKAAVQ